jgi:hypothetical protein
VVTSLATSGMDRNSARTRRRDPDGCTSRCRARRGPR